jgi:hypothetical protein
MISWLASAGEPVLSSNTGGYTQAKQRLPEGVFRRLFHYTGAHMEQQAKAADLWCGRSVKILDGANVAGS